mmetsp:Transcript_3750/g.4681  ORF Transcript_3750/g.4681 Transcript_3750/m.4681 type:complete len:305 (-) Transcript_3750:386-1300(-)|eukprot:CAMPEP_0204842464 /NCGR_PEP_ID=MMETSP1346-20131115/46413_1 /ASSEMBLY_ACC=CAM_ASM_000771 /TAXON_ID=215587 /ORGANISM="Aplanochytrium stocchinoi, Strain GSBS06" /LENGTH=304 /DNA_ID=CAMNT_0051981275 /DNA_START=11 /DNA_END=925 /DNA_ORIENTATION=+
MSGPSSTHTHPYCLKQLKQQVDVVSSPNSKWSFGAVVEGVDLNKATTIPAETVEHIKQDLFKYRFLVFKGQGHVSAGNQLAVSRWFGRVESTFSKHPRSPDSDILRVSNDPEEGCTNVGRSGWHIDGSFMRQPFKVQTMHFWSVSKSGSTWFTPLNEVIQKLPPETRKLWNDLYFYGDAIHPLIYPHPATNLDTMVFHCGPPFVHGFLKGFREEDNSAEEIYDFQRTSLLLSEITNCLEDPELMHVQNWDEGDFAIIDNLGCAHYAPPETQLPRSSVGLRILHRTTVAGDTKPKTRQQDLHTCE